MFALTRTLSKKLTRGIDTMFYSRNVKKGAYFCISDDTDILLAG